MARNFIPLFINTLVDDEHTRRFGEMQGSYPVLRIFDPNEHEIADRLDGNPVRGDLKVSQLLTQMRQALSRS